MQPGEISAQRSDHDVVVVSLTGEHDLTTAPTLREQLDDALGQGAAVVVNLSGAEFIDSSIIGVLVDMHKRASEAGLGFATALENGAAPVRRVLEVTGLDRSLPVRDSEREAIEMATGGG